jgi:hypothetical protein
VPPGGQDELELREVQDHTPKEEALIPDQQDGRLGQDRHKRIADPLPHKHLGVGHELDGLLEDV